MAPELFDSKKSQTIGVEIDIWAFGCILIEIFSNKRPWSHIASSNVNCIYYELFNKRPIPIPSCIPEPIKRIIQRACDYCPESRPNAAAMLQELLNIREVCSHTHSAGII